jgi:hypothetical protein
MKGTKTSGMSRQLRNIYTRNVGTLGMMLYKNGKSTMGILQSSLVS